MLSIAVCSFEAVIQVSLFIWLHHVCTDTVTELSVCDTDTHITASEHTSHRNLRLNALSMFHLELPQQITSYDS